MRYLITAAAGLAIAVAAFTAGHYTAPHGIRCATEDSCAYSYAHHTGTVVRITP